jgi:hypothetical protein
MTIKPVSYLGTIFKALSNAILHLGVLLLWTGCILIFMNSYNEYIQELPTIIIVGIPVGFIALTLKIATINFGFRDTQKPIELLK